MTPEFFARKQELIAQGRRFTQADLKKLPYPDVKRASIGDAGEAACSQELVDAELRQRLSAYRDLTLERLPTFVAELTSLGMLDDVRRMAGRSNAGMEWATLPPQWRAYLLIRCLRAHADQPGPRLDRLIPELDQLISSDEDPKQVSLAIILKARVQELKDACASAGKSPDIMVIRKKFVGFEVLQAGLPVEERSVLTTLNVRGYHCTGGCFFPSWM